MSGMLLASRFFDGLYVLRNAHMIEADRIKMNSCLGKVSGVGMPMNIERCRAMPQPTHVPITTPENELERTKMNASYIKSLVMMPFVKPIERMTEISFTCSYKFPVIDDDSEKKQMNIVMAMMMLKIISSVFSAYQAKSR